MADMVGKTERTDKMSYKVTIEKTESVIQTQIGQWTQLRTDDPTMGYAPNREVPAEKSTLLLEQTVETLNIPLLAAMINGFPVVLDLNAVASNIGYTILPCTKCDQIHLSPLEPCPK